MDDPFVLTDFEGPVAVVRLNRPEVLNALSPSMLHVLAETLEALDRQPEIKVIVITGSAKAFAAGADIQVMAQSSSTDMLRLDTRQYWLRLRAIQKPLIAAVMGYAFGGGCELALSCDLIVAAEDARFGQPEIKLGIMPGAGGTQRLVKAIGPYRTMEMILTGEPISGSEAYTYGIANRAVPAERCLAEAIDLATTIANRPTIAVRLAREAVRYGVETTLREGLEVERRNFLLLFDTIDKTEGMMAFLEKRSPKFKGE
jgi:enoyl-CoA hydratase